MIKGRIVAGFWVAMALAPGACHDSVTAGSPPSLASDSGLDSDASGACEAQSTRPCDCPQGKGVQTCKSDGAGFGPCTQCNPMSDAASEDSAQGGAAGASGAAGTGGFPAGWCAFHSPSIDCDACMAENCMAECRACMNEPGCNTALDCVLKCAWNDKPCVVACFQALQGTESKALFNFLLMPGNCGPDMCGVVCNFEGANPEHEWTGPGSKVDCGTTSCHKGQICCWTTGACIPAQDECPALGQSQKACGSNADCGSGEYCQSDLLMCIGPGYCRSSGDKCGYGGGHVCGCNGHTYFSPADACAVGVRAPMNGGCGDTVYGDLVRCGNDSSWCPDGEDCCAITGFCYDPAHPGVCAIPPEGTFLPCEKDSDCPNLNGQPFCRGVGCGLPGGCVTKPDPVGCNPNQEQVCGCDGKTYASQCEADANGVTVDHTGACGDGG